MDNPNDHIIVSKSLIRMVYDVLSKLNYNEDDPEYGCDFHGKIDSDLFYSVKWDIEKLLNT